MPKRTRLALPLAVPLMIVTIVSIAGFQLYWMRMLYAQEWAELKKETDIDFRVVVYKLQMQNLQNDSLFFRHDLPRNLFLFNVVDSLRTRFVDSFDPGPGPGNRLAISIREFNTRDSAGRDVRARIVSNEPESPLSTARIDSAYRLELAKSHITVPFRIERIQGPARELDYPTPADTLKTNFMYIGLSNGYNYEATFGSPVRYILRRMVWPITAGVLLVGFTALAFVVLYRNLQQQQRLAQYKNDFISNMTHELKTPISTIKVAVEALRHFDALDDPKRTREYLDISAVEVQRLSLLVDKVLKLSQFENKELELHVTVFDLREVAAEVMAEMRLTFEKAGAVVQLTANSGDGVFHVRGDRAHLSSVISNLLDNALKYSKEAPVITVRLWREDGMILLSVTDNGIGIPAAYQDRIFDKFFRVPSDDHHNIKGYGLGLNYVQDIIHIHKGSIGVESKEGRG
ncbi:MAG TPA: HAMP domain-containing sensor histidine kinase, partial [Puia sp.]|nr:HAMP domain-containing sensor histidine kinase [Puia sp.]